MLGLWEQRRWQSMAGVFACLLMFIAGWMVARPQASAAATTTTATWTSAGNGPTDDRYQPDETIINPLNVGRLKPEWVFTTHGSVEATPVVGDGNVYFPDFGGYMNAVNAATGTLVWQQQISAYDGVTGSIVRNSPVLDGNELIFGDSMGGVHPQGAHVFAVDAQTGALLWSTQVEANPSAIVTGSPLVVDGTVLIGVSSDEENNAQSTSYPCCTFRGSLVALNASTGDVEWQTYTMPANNDVPCVSDNPPAGCGYSGGAVWDDPAVDVATNQVFVGDGNNYTTPDADMQCAQQAEQNGTSPADCTPADDTFDTEFGLNLSTGSIDWDYRATGWDAYTLACLLQNGGVNWCPDPKGPDWDFGSGPNLITIPASGGGTQTIVAAGQKAGIFWAFDAATGNVLWHTQVGPGTPLGGVMWGTASDGKRIYVHESDPEGISYTLADGVTDKGGSWGALNPATGAWDWQRPTPFYQPALGPMTVANGVVYAGTVAPRGNNMFAISARTGLILWRFASGASVSGGPAVANGTVYWGAGTPELASLGYTSGTKLYAFTVNGEAPTAAKCVGGRAARSSSRERSHIAPCVAELTKTHQRKSK